MESNYISEVPLGVFRSAAGQFDSATLLSAIAGLATVMAKGPVMLVIQVEAQNFRWTDDGQNPTAALGMQIFPYTTTAPIQLVYTGRSYQSLKFLSLNAGGFIDVAVYSHTKDMG